MYDTMHIRSKPVNMAGAIVVATLLIIVTMFSTGVMAADSSFAASAYPATEVFRQRMPTRSLLETHGHDDKPIVGVIDMHQDELNNLVDKLEEENTDMKDAIKDLKEEKGSQSALCTDYTDQLIDAHDAAIAAEEEAYEAALSALQGQLAEANTAHDNCEAAVNACQAANAVTSASVDGCNTAKQTATAACVAKKADLLDSKCIDFDAQITSTFDPLLEKINNATSLTRALMVDRHTVHNGTCAAEKAELINTTGS